MSWNLAGALVGGGCCLVASPYLAQLAGPQLARPAGGLADPRRWRWRTAALATCLGGLAGTAAGFGALFPAFVVLAALCTPLIVIDIAEHRLPNRLVLAAAVGAATLLPFAALLRQDGTALLRSVQAAAAVFTALFVLALAAPGSFGLGDVKLGGVLGAYLGWFGWSEVCAGIFTGFLLGSLVAVALLSTRRASLKTAIAFGPMLIGGALAVLACTPVPAG